MPEYVAPGAAISSRLVLGPEDTGLVGTVRFRLVDDDAVVDDPVIGPVTTGIIEDPSGSGTYLWRGSAPTVMGKYAPLWDKGAGTPLIPDEDIIVTANAALPFTPSGNEYVTRAELKTMLNLTGETYADADIDVAVEAASRAIDNYKRSRFYPTTETRYYSAESYDEWIAIDDLVAVTSVSVDTDGNGTYDTSWVEVTDYVLDPPNAPLEGQPRRKLRLLGQAGRSFPSYRNSIRVVGSFGWTVTPVVVRQAARILAARLLKRGRETPYGILLVTGDAVAAARLGRIDPDVAFLLDNLPGSRQRLLV